ncbi:MAG: hypothetical protein D6744_07705 [Planctomycetota bacterium]|nr:MAG: hypothetical protein D6744_07705 [Planctomycetota bacterium]
MDFRNTTAMDSNRLRAMFVRHTEPYAHDRLVVRVRYSRGADFSGTCFHKDGRIFVNIGRHTSYPYAMATHLAKACSNRTHWWRELFTIHLADAYQLALFVYLHELYHYLVYAARRNPRRKEAMCDRFAARVLVDSYGCAVTDERRFPVERRRWDFRDLHAFVSAAPRAARAGAADVPVRILGA